MKWQVTETKDSFLVIKKHLKDAPPMVFSKDDERFKNAGSVVRWVVRNTGISEADIEYKNMMYNRKNPRERNVSKLEQARINKGLTQRALSEALGIKQPRLSEYERGIHVPSATMAVRIAEVLGVDVKDVI